MRKHIYTGAMGNIWAMLISGIFFVYFGTAIGLSRFQWGLMAGVSSWLIAVQPLSALLTERTGKRKVVWFYFAVAERGMRLVGIFLSLWLWQAGWPHAGVILMVAVCLSNFFGAMATPPWLSWLADIIPADEHGAFWGRRAAWIALSVAAVVLPAGYFADRMPQEHKLHAMVAIFVVATAVGILDLIIHGTIPEPIPLIPERSHFLAWILKPIRDHNFRPWLTFNICWTFSMTLGGALAALYFLDELGIKDNFLGGTVVLTCFLLLGSLSTGRWSGRLVDRAGTTRVLFWGHLFWSLLPLFWLAASPRMALLWLGASSLLGGIACTAATTAANKLITRLPPPELRATYIAVSTSLGSLAGGFGVVTAGTILRCLGDWNLEVGGFDLGAFGVLFIASVFLRLGSTLLLVRRINV
jgi:MFS family permease